MNMVDLFDRPIAFHRCFVTITGSITAAVMLSQAFYWSKRTTLEGNWFWKTQEEWLEETGLTRYEQEGARKTLKRLGIFEEKKEGIPAKLYFRINTKAMYELLEIVQKTQLKPSNIKDVTFTHTGMLETSNLGAEKLAGKEAENQPYISESTSEITSKTTTEIQESAYAPTPPKPKKQAQEKQEKSSFIIPESINPVSWAEFEQHRKEIKKPITDLGRTKATNVLSAYSFDDQQFIIDNSINGKYPGLYPDCLYKKQQKAFQQKTPISKWEMPKSFGDDNAIDSTATIVQQNYLQGI